MLLPNCRNFDTLRIHGRPNPDQAMVIVGRRFSPTHAMVIVGRCFEHRRTAGIADFHGEMAVAALDRKHDAGHRFLPVERLSPGPHPWRHLFKAENGYVPP